MRNLLSHILAAALFLISSNYLEANVLKNETRYSLSGYFYLPDLSGNVVKFNVRPHEAVNVHVPQKSMETLSLLMPIGRAPFQKVQLFIKNQDTGNKLDLGPMTIDDERLDLVLYETINGLEVLIRTPAKLYEFHEAYWQN